MKSRILIRKLSFLLHILSDTDGGVAASAMHALLDDPDAICLVKECRELEAVYVLKLTDKILCDPHAVSVQGIKKAVLKADKDLLFNLCSVKAPLIAEVVKRGGSWPALWDTVRHLGSRHTSGLQHLSRMIAHHGKGSNPCPRCEGKPSSTNLTEHILSMHNDTINLQPQLTTETLLGQLAERNVLFSYRFRNLFNFIP